MKLSLLPPSERPRERLLALGPSALSTAELLAIVIGSGTVQHSALELAHKIVCLEGWSDLSVEELCAIPGLGQAKALKLHAAFALAARIQPQQHGVRIKTAYDAYHYVKGYFEGEKREMFGALLLDTKCQVIRFEVISLGTLSETLVHPRETFRPAIRQGAASVILVHNHPSGDPTPSTQDLQLNERLMEAGRLLDVPVLDHLVLGQKTFVSLLERGDTFSTRGQADFRI